jgi:hypothetical protein
MKLLKEARGSFLFLRKAILGRVVVLVWRNKAESREEERRIGRE